MADAISTYFAVFKADLDGFTAPLRDAQKQAQELNNAAKPLTNLFKDIGESATRFGSILTVGLTAPIVAFGAVAVKNFGESAQAVAQMEAALLSMGDASGKTSAELVKLAKSLEGASLFDDDEILDKVINNLLTFGNISGQVFDQAAQAAVNLAARLGTDLQSATIQVGKALNDPIKGLTALQRIGISFTEDQKEMIKALVETGNTMEAQQIIMAELTREFDGQAEAMTRVGTGPMKQLQIQFGNMTESYGKVITEAINPFILKLTEGVKWMDTWSDSTKIMVAGTAGIASAIGPAVFTVGQLSLGISTMIPLISKLSITFLGAEGSAVLFGAGATAAGAAIVGLAAAISTLTSVGLPKLAFDKILPDPQELGRNLRSVFDQAFGFASEVKYEMPLPQVPPKLPANWIALSTAIHETTIRTEEQKKAAEAYAKAVDGIVDAVTGNITHTRQLTDAVKALQAAHVPAEEIVRKLGTQIQAEAEFAKAAGRELNATLAPLNAMIAATKEFVITVEAARLTVPMFQADLSELTQDATDRMVEMGKMAKEKLGEVLTKQYSVVQATMQGMIDVTKLANEIVPASLDHIKGIEDANAQHTKDNLEALGKAQKDHADKVTAVMTTAAGNVTSGFAKAFTDTIRNGGDFAAKMIDIVLDMAEQMLQSLLVGLFAPLTAKLAGLGSSLGGLVGGGGGAAGAAAGAAGGVTGGGGGGIGGVLGGLSPWGIGIGAGLVAGIGAWIKSQAHHEANTVVQNIENPWWSAVLKMLPSDRYADLAMLPGDEAGRIAANLVELNKNYLALGSEFAKGGSDQAKVWEQSKANTQPRFNLWLEALSKAEAFNPKKAGSTTMPDMGQTGTPISLEQMYPGLKQLAMGTDYVPKTGPYMLHQGEAVIPADQNGRSINLNFGNIHVNGRSGRELAEDFIRQLRLNGEFKTQLRQAIIPSTY